MSLFGVWVPPKYFMDLLTLYIYIIYNYKLCFLDLLTLYTHVNI